MKNHLFAEVEGRNWLVDTCGPASFSEHELEICGMRVTSPFNICAWTAKGLSEDIGYKTDGLIGSDILSALDVCLDLQNEQITFSKGFLDAEGLELETRVRRNLPVITVGIKGEMYDMLFDTGAPLSYFQDDSLTTYPAAGEYCDFHPNLGPFTTDTYLIDIDVGDRQHKIRFGYLPLMLHTMVAMAHTKGIVGTELIKGGKMNISLRRKQIILA